MGIDQIPCKNCITLPMCKAKALQEVPNMEGQILDLLLLMKSLTDKCSILDDYTRGPYGPNKRLYDRVEIVTKYLTTGVDTESD